MGNKQKKAAKRKAKRKDYIRDRNVSKNQAHARYRLDVLFPDGWKSMAGFKSLAQVQAYSDEQETIRKRGDTEILEGVIIDIRTDRQIHRVPPFKPEESGLEAAKAAEPRGFLSDVKSVKDEKISENELTSEESK